MRRALDQLRDEGLVIVQPGQGRVIASPDVANREAQPQYRRIATDIRTRIELGDVQPREPIPSESALMERYQVARGTVRQALAELDGAGLVGSVHGEGRLVKSR